MEDTPPGIEPGSFAEPRPPRDVAGRQPKIETVRNGSNPVGKPAKGVWKLRFRDKKRNLAAASGEVLFLMHTKRHYGTVRRQDDLLEEA